MELPGLGADRGDLDHGGAGQPGVGGEALDDRGEPPLDPLLPLQLFVAAGVHLGEKPLDQHVVGGEEAVVLAVEVPVEGGERDTGLLRHLLNRSSPVAGAADDLDHRLEDRFPSRRGGRWPGPELKTAKYVQHCGICTRAFTSAFPAPSP